MSIQEHPDQATVSKPDYLSLYSAQEGESCYPGYTQFPPSQIPWGFLDLGPTVGPAYTHIDGYANSSCIIEKGDQDMSSGFRPESGTTLQGYNQLYRDPSNRTPSDLQDGSFRAASLKMVSPGSETFAFSTSRSSLVPNRSQMSSSVSAPGLRSSDTIGLKGKPRLSKHRNKGLLSAAHCDLEGFARWKVRKRILKYPASESKLVEKSLIELKRSAVRAKIHGKSLCAYQTWAAQRANVEDKDVKLCIDCFKTFGVLLPKTDTKEDPNGCRCKRVGLKEIEANNKASLETRLKFSARVAWHPMHPPIDLA